MTIDKGCGKMKNDSVSLIFLASVSYGVEYVSTDDGPLSPRSFEADFSSRKSCLGCLDNTCPKKTIRLLLKYIISQR